MAWRDFPKSNPSYSEESEVVDLYPTYPSCACHKPFGGRKLVEKGAGVNEPVSRALLISGSNELRHYWNLEGAYLAMLKSGFYTDNIRVLSNYGPDPGIIPGCLPADMDTLTRALLGLIKVSKPEDRVVFYYTGHGGKDNIGGDNFSLSDNNESYFLDFGKNFLSAHKLSKYLRKIDLKWGLLVFSQCYGGGLAEDMGHEKFIAFSASRGDELAYGGTFATAFFDEGWGLRRADYDKDRHVSVKDLYRYVLEHDVNCLAGNQHPQLCSDLDTSEAYVL